MLYAAVRFFGLPIALVALAACQRGGGNNVAAEAASGFENRALTPFVEQAERQGVAPLASLAPEGLRVSIAPSFGDYVLIVDFVPERAGCTLVIEPGPNGETRPGAGCHLVEVHYSLIGREEHPATPRHYRFFVPEEELRHTLATFEGLARGWRDPGGRLDGTTIGVERYRQGRLVSLASNGIEPSNPAAFLSIAVSRILLAYGPASAVPRKADFTINAEGAREEPCWAPEFATSDPDGFGTGNDACARWRASRGQDRPARDQQPAGQPGNSVE